MAIKRLSSITGDPISTQRAITNALQSLQTIPILDGALIENISLEASNNVIKHSLNRNFTGAIIVKQNNVSDITTDQATNLAPSKYIHIQSSAQAIISIWIF